MQIQLLPGDLHQRLHLNFDRLEREDYAPANLFARDAAGGWPGDTVGRTILSWASLAAVTGRAPRYLHDVLARLPDELNERGYLGPVQEALDEQQLAGHGWLVSGLLEAYALLADPALLSMARRMVDGLFMQVRGKMADYPSNPADRIVAGEAAGTHVTTLAGWTISSDTGCVFIALEGLVKAHAIFQRAHEKALIDEMLASFRAMNLVGLSAQLHASLTATRQMLAYHDMECDAALLSHAEQVYGIFRNQAITENYANYNWFNRPTWTEPCAVVDAFIVALQLWHKTGKPSYLDDAHHIYYNALGYAQKPHGGFGLENCVGATSPDVKLPEGMDATMLCNHTYDVWWCCNMRGSVGLATAARWAMLHDRVDEVDRITIPFYFDADADMVLADGRWHIEQRTQYPVAGRTSVVLSPTGPAQRATLRMVIPGWVQPDSVVVALNGAEVQGYLTDGFVAITRLWQHGDRLDLTFSIVDRTEPVLLTSHVHDHHTHRHGPLIMGRTPEGHMKPLNDVITMSEEGARTDRRRILFW